MITHTLVYEQILNNYLSPKKTQRKPKYASGINYVLAVSGAAASGKTTSSKGMVEFLHAKGISAVHVPLDGYLLDRQARKERNLSGYDPRSSNIALMITHMKALVFDGKPIDLPIYDHKSGGHEAPRILEPAEVIIFDGIMSLQTEIRQLFPNLHIFFTSDDIIIRGLRLKVDMAERGYSVFQALVHSDEEFSAYNKWIRPQLKYAHIIILVGEQWELSIQSENNMF